MKMSEEKNEHSLTNVFLMGGIALVILPIIKIIELKRFDDMNYDDTLLKVYGINHEETITQLHIGIVLGLAIILICLMNLSRKHNA